MHRGSFGFSDLYRGAGVVHDGTHLRVGPAVLPRADGSMRSLPGDRKAVLLQLPRRDDGHVEESDLREQDPGKADV
jgi:hypothetical protein